MPFPRERCGIALTNSGSGRTFVPAPTSSKDGSLALGHVVFINCSQTVRICRVPLVMERRGWIGYRAERAWPPTYLVVQLVDWSSALE